jgi:hypothetical protein
VRLGDGEPQDRAENLCKDAVNRLPRCMDLITPAEVASRIELYFDGGRLKYLSKPEKKAAQRGVTTSARNRFDQLPLNLHSANLACEEFIKTIPACPPRFRGRGVVICGGGVRYFTCAWVCVNMLRRVGCRLPVELWHLGPKEMSEPMKALLRPLGVEFMDACRMRKRFPARILRGWELKAYSIVHSRFREILFLDADNVPTCDPEFLFETAEFREAGAVFWPDYGRVKGKKAKAIWRSCGMRRPGEQEFETGQIVVDKGRCWKALRLALWFNENSDFYYQYVHGDKETFHLAFRKLKQPYRLVHQPIESLEGVMCQHDFEGRRIFQHRNTDKWDFFLHNRRMKGFRFEEECREYVRRLQRRWDGNLGNARNGHNWHSKAFRTVKRGLRIAAVMISCPERKELRRQTLENLARTDWDEPPAHVEVDAGSGKDFKRRQTRCACLALKASLEFRADYILFLEDDLEFNRHLRHNLLAWRPIRSGEVPLASVYNPRVRESGCDLRNRARLVPPRAVFGSQAFLISRNTVEYVLHHWHQVQGMQDIRISRLAGRLGSAVLYHAPSLVQHVGKKSLWNGVFHQADDFDPEWKG